MTTQSSAPSFEHDPVYMNPDLPISVRVDNLVSRMTLTEKVSQMLHGAPAIERLGVPEYKLVERVPARRRSRGAGHSFSAGNRAGEHVAH